MRGLIEDLWHLKVKLKVKKELSLPNNSLNSEICIKRKEKNNIAVIYEFPDTIPQCVLIGWKLHLMGV